MVTVQRLYGSELEKKTASLILLHVAQVCVPILSCGPSVAGIL